MLEVQFVGIDVSAKTLRVAVEVRPGVVEDLEFANSAEGHRQLCRRLTKKGRKAQVVLEATGLYSLDLALVLHREPQIEVMVANPRAVHNFARAFLQRSKTDVLDTRTLLEFGKRMPFRVWQPPAVERLELRAISRRIADLTQSCTQEKNRLHAASSCELGRVVRRDVEIQIRHLQRRMARLEQQALALIARSADLSADLALLTSVKGIAAKSAIQILAELCVLPEDMAARQWVAYAGIDPRQVESGSSVHKPARISRAGNARLRAALYMPALVAIQHEPHVKAFYEQLLARGKKPLQATVAVMRKLLHSIFGMLRTGTPFEGKKFRRLASAEA